jgi:hypothetical protein
VRARDVVSKIDKAKCGGDKACVQTGQRGSHRKFECACKGQTCRTSVPMHPGDLGTGLLHKIERELEPCLGEGWLTG